MGEVSGAVAEGFWSVTYRGIGCTGLAKSGGEISQSSARRFVRQYSGLWLKHEHIQCSTMPKTLQ